MKLSLFLLNDKLNLGSEKFGNKIENIVFYFVFGLFKIAVIVQQIFFRYKNGFTKDARFKHLNHVVKAYSFLAIKSIEKQKIELWLNIQFIVVFFLDKLSKLKAF